MSSHTPPIALEGLAPCGCKVVNVTFTRCGHDFSRVHHCPEFESQTEKAQHTSQKVRVKTDGVCPECSSLQTPQSAVQAAVENLSDASVSKKQTPSELKINVAHGRSSFDKDEPNHSLPAFDEDSFAIRTRKSHFQAVRHENDFTSSPPLVNQSGEPRFLEYADTYRLPALKYDPTAPGNAMFEDFRENALAAMRYNRIKSWAENLEDQMEKTETTTEDPLFEWLSSDTLKPVNGIPAQYGRQVSSTLAIQDVDDAQNTPEEDDQVVDNLPVEQEYTGIQFEKDTRKAAGLAHQHVQIHLAARVAPFEQTHTEQQHEDGHKTALVSSSTRQNQTTNSIEHTYTGEQFEADARNAAGHISTVTTLTNKPIPRPKPEVDKILPQLPSEPAKGVKHKASSNLHHEFPLLPQEEGLYPNIRSIITRTYHKITDKIFGNKNNTNSSQPRKMRPSSSVLSRISRASSNRRKSFRARRAESLRTNMLERSRAESRAEGDWITGTGNGTTTVGRSYRKRFWNTV